MIKKQNPESTAMEIPVSKAEPRPWRFLAMLLKLRAFEALRYRDYRLIWFGQVFSSMGTWMDEVARGWLIYELTDSVVQLGLVRGVQAIPFLLLAPIAGSAADRYPRKAQVIAAQFVTGSVYSLTALLIVTGHIRPWHVYVASFVLAITQAFQQPARTAMVADVVPLKCLTNAIGLNAMINNVSRSIGPAVAGIVIAWLGTGATYFVQGAFFFMATVWTFQITSAQNPAKRTDGRTIQRESFGQSILSGWKFSWKNEAVRTGLMTVMFVSLFIVPFTTLLPVFARDVLGVGARGQGLLLTAMGLGALCSAALIAAAGDKLPKGILMLGSVMLYGCVLVAFAASPWFSLSIVMMVIVGLCHVHSHALVQTVIQAYSPPEYRGRTMAIFTMSRVVMMLGSIVIGAMSSLLGAPLAVASMGAVGALTMVAIFLALPYARLIR